jgi:hypothetical protein
VRKTRISPMRVALFAGVLLPAASFAGTARASPPLAGAVTVNRVTACNSVHDPGPGYNASIGTAQNGETVCITVGEKLLVFLAAPAATTLGWAPIRVAPQGILTAAPLSLMLSRNVTAENFFARRQGLVELSSQRPACNVPPRSQVFCGAVLRWDARVEVLAKRKIQLPPVPVTGRLVPVPSSS